jgi:hypothetical protein
MNPKPNRNTDEELIKQFLDNGGTVKKGKTKPMPSELGISNNNWNNKLTKDEKKAKGSK